MASAPTFEQVLGQSDRPQRTAAPVEERAPWNSWESWVTFGIVILVQLPVVGSLQSADWVREMPSLMSPMAIALVVAWALGHSRLSTAVSMAIALVVGAVATVGMVLHTMVLVDPTHSGLQDRWWEFRFRLLEWGRALLGDGISTDPLPFVVMLVGVVYLVGILSTWAVVRWHNPWVALIPGGFVLLTNISYLPGQPSFAFVLFLLAAILLVARLTFLQSLQRWRSEGVAPREGMSLEVLLVAGAVSLVLITTAWIIPTANNWGPVADTWGRVLAPVQDRVDRLGQLFVGVGSKKPIPVHSMDAVLPLQGQVALDRDVLYEVVAPGEMNLRGAVYDEYTGSGWRVSSAAAVPLVGTTVEAAQLGTPSSRAQIREALRVDVTVLHQTAPTNVLLSIGDPIASDRDATLVVDSVGSPLQLRPESPPRAEDSYSTVGTRSIAAVDTLKAAGTSYPPEVARRYLALPDGLPPEVGQLAREVAGDAVTPYDAARRIEEYLRENYTFRYDIDAPPPGRDAVAHFLFESREGYFDLFASSMAVMLRTLNVPTRVAVGFALDDIDFDATAKAYRVTEERAWSWPEVYFPDLGWVEFNPTPSRDRLVRPGDDSAARAAAAALSGEFNPDDELAAGFEADLLGGNASFTSDTEETGPSAAERLIARIIGWLLVGATGLLLAIVAVRVAWQRLFRGLSPAAARWAKVQAFARLAGLTPAPERTPMEGALDLATRLGEREAFLLLARSYSRSRYGGPEVADETAEEATARDQAYRTVRGILVRLVLRRVARLGRIPGGALPGRHTPTTATR